MKRVPAAEDSAEALFELTSNCFGERSVRSAFESGSPDAPWIRHCAQLLEAMGAVVMIGPSQENLCRRVSEGERERHRSADWVVACQGLPNLVHELVHAQFLGEMADDHGFDYGWIPLDPTGVDHRRAVWEELSSCVLSVEVCRPMRGPDFPRDWFAEQFEIQGVFHGLEHDLSAFRQRIDGLLNEPRFRSELCQVVDAARSRLARQVGGVDALRTWSEYRATW